MNSKEAKKQDIAQSARELFADFGYKSVSMDQIAARANVAKGTLYLYFKDKEDLFDYLAQEFISGMRECVVAIEKKHLSLIDEIHEVVYNLLIYRKNQKFIFKIAQEAKEMRTPSARRVIQMIDDEISHYLEERLKEAADNKIIKAYNTTLLSFILIKIYTALAFEWEEAHRPLNEREIAESVSLFLKEGLLGAK